MAETSPKTGQELFYHLIGKIFDEQINSFSELKEYLAKIAPATLTDVRYYAMINKVFSMIRRLSWGFFTNLNKQNFERLWNELVVEDKRWTQAGDLKKTITLSNLFIGMLDIHGYTKFCNENKARLDRLHLFDRTIATEVQRISAECQSICKRERGDEMLIISASATDCIMAAVSIIDFFACTNSLPGSTINTERHGDIAVLPQFKISAGIAGGQTPLIITETGNLSGPLLNTAARLQMRANELSPKESKIMTTQQVKILVEKEAKRIPSPLLESGALQFYETGQIEFKGVMLVCCEILFKDSEKYKSGFVEESAKLELALKQGLWEHNVFVCLLNLIIKALTTMPPFSIGANNVDGSASAPITNAVLERKCLTSLNAFLHKQNYFKALEALADIIKKIEVIPEFDRLTLDYAHGIYEKYCLVLRPYEEIMNQYIEEKRSEIFNEKDLAIYDTLKKNNGLYEKLRLSARESPKLVQRKAYWNLVIKQHKEKMMMHLYSGKK